MPPGEEKARALARAAAIDVDPNLVSFASLLSAILAGASFYVGRPLAGALFLALAGYLDLVDGEVARKYSAESGRGDFLDHTFDRLADTSIFVGLGLGPLAPLDWALAAAVSTLMVAYLGTQAEAVGLGRVYGGLARRSNVLGLVFVASLIQPFNAEALLLGAVLVVVLSAETFIQRFLRVYRGLG